MTPEHTPAIVSVSGEMTAGKHWGPPGPPAFSEMRHPLSGPLIPPGPDSCRLWCAPLPTRVTGSLSCSFPRVALWAPRRAFWSTQLAPGSRRAHSRLGFVVLALPLWSELHVDMLAWTWGVRISFRGTWVRLTWKLALSWETQRISQHFSNDFALVLHKYSIVLNCAVQFSTLFKQ